jgi:phosphatidylinositol dimannoside acyltransferase
MGTAETWGEWLTFWSHRTLAAAAPAVPETMGRAVAVLCGSLAYYSFAGRRTVVAANQARALGLDCDDVRVRRSTHEAFRLYARYWFDTFQVGALGADALAARVEVHGLEHVDAALAHGRGCLVALPHLGNWDAVGRLLAIKGYRLAAVAENLRPPRLAALFRSHRERLGMRIVPLVGEHFTLREIERLLADNWLVALLSDRALSSRGVEVEMFGARRSIAVGPAMLSLSTGAPVLAAATYTAPNGWRLEVGPPLTAERHGDRRADVTALARVVAAALERAIAEHPADWHLFQPGWQ